jgi:hypothetical protein
VPDIASREFTIALAYQARETHGPVGGRCEHCRVPWPCEAAQRVEDVIRLLTPPAPRWLGRARVTPSATAADGHGEQSFRWLPSR